MDKQLTQAVKELKEKNYRYAVVGISNNIQGYYFTRTALVEDETELDEAIKMFQFCTIYDLVKGKSFEK